MPKLQLALVALLLAHAALAQMDANPGHPPGQPPGQLHGHPPGAHGGHHSPYADQEPSGIAALSRQEVEDLEAGAGMGLARAAELHSYPGPRHVLELATELGLTDEQRQRVETIHREMAGEAKRLGAEILDLERQLDRRFAHRHIDEATLRDLTAKIGALQGELRAAHLVAHLRTTAVLGAEQVSEYDRLRGYRAP